MCLLFPTPSEWDVSTENQTYRGLRLSYCKMSKWLSCPSSRQAQSSQPHCKSVHQPCVSLSPVPALRISVISLATRSDLSGRPSVIGGVLRLHLRCAGASSSLLRSLSVSLFSFNLHAKFKARQIRTELGKSSMLGGDIFASQPCALPGFCSEPWTRIMALLGQIHVHNLANL